MSEVLYQKYRPRNFDGIVGQEAIVNILKNSVANGKIGHAYLFVGPRGTGKTSTARILAKSINASLKDGNPDPEAESSKSIDQGTFIDLIEIDAASNRGIDEVRDLKEKVNFAPVQGKYKVYIIDEVHMMTKEAFNALLKTLEEPPKHVVFILATTEVHKVPATILSRCQRYDFRLGNKEAVISNIREIIEKEAVKIEDEGLDLIYESSGGSFRDSLSILELVVTGQKQSDDPSEVTTDEVRLILGLPDTTMVYYFLDNLVKGDSVHAINLIAEISTKGIDLHQFIFSSLSVLRKALINKMKGDEVPDEASFSKKLHVNDIVRLISLFVEADQEVKFSPIPSLPLEMLVAKYSALGNSEAEDSGVPIPKKPEGKDNTGPETTSKKENKTPEPKEEKSDDKPSAKSEVIGSRLVKTLSVEELSSKWSAFIEKVKPSNGYFHMFLAKSTIKEVSSDRVLLSVPFSFHKDRIEEPSNKEIIAQAMTDIWGQALRVECEVDSNMGDALNNIDTQNIISSGMEPKPEDNSRIVKKEEGSLNAAGADVKDRVSRLQSSISRGSIKNDKDIDPGVMTEVLDVFV
jgi:DNA polymerase III subunit gamma/tau